MKRKYWKTLLFMLIVITIAIIVRVLYVQDKMEMITMVDDSYQKAVISSHGVYKIQSFSLNECYTKILSIFLLICGNYKLVGVYLNIVLQVIAIVLLYYALNAVANISVAFFVSIVFSAMPFYINKVLEISPFNMLIVICVIGLYIVAQVCRRVIMLTAKKKEVEQKDRYQEANKMEENESVITLDDIIGMNEEKSNGLKESVQDAEDGDVTTKIEDVVPPGMKEIIMDEEEKKKKVKFLENPLPVPKRHKRKEMDFAIDLNEENNDFDIKDLLGMDYFDIE